VRGGFPARVGAAHQHPLGGVVPMVVVGSWRVSCFADEPVLPHGEYVRGRRRSLRRPRRARHGHVGLPVWPSLDRTAGHRQPLRGAASV